MIGGSCSWQIGLAWMHHFTLEQYQGEEEDYTLGEIVFSKGYCEEKGQVEIWNIMSYYNEAIASAMLHPPMAAVNRDFGPLTSLEDAASFGLLYRKSRQSQ